MFKRERYYTTGHGVNDNAARELFTQAINLAQNINDVNRIVFIAHGLQNNGWLNRVFGEQLTKEIQRGTKLSKDSRITVHFESLKTYNSRGNEVLITLGLKSDEILELESEYNISAIFALPWLEDDVVKWSRISNAKNIETGETTDPFPTPHCIVISALEDLTRAINMSTGIIHPSDNQLAKTYLRALIKYGIELNEIEIEAYLISQLGWQKKYADDLLEIINKINSGRSFQGGDKSGLSYYYKRWTKRCEGNRD